MGDGFLSPLFEIDANRRDDATGTWMKFYAKNFGMSSVDARVEYLKQGDLGVTFDYSQITRDAPYKVRTGLQGIGTATMQVNGVGGTFAKQDLQLQTSRDVAQISFFKSLTPALDVLASFRNDEKTGTRHWGAGSNPYFLVEPIDHTMRTFDLTLNYTTEKLQLSGGYSGSFFDNQYSFVTARVASATTPTASGPNIVPLTMPLDNSAHQVFLNGGYSYSGTTRVTFRSAFTRAVLSTARSIRRFCNLASRRDRFRNSPSSPASAIRMSMTRRRSPGTSETIRRGRSLFTTHRTRSRPRSARRRPPTSCPWQSVRLPEPKSANRIAATRCS
jgi:hypothetical protein